MYEAVDVSNNNLSVALKVMNTREGVMQMPVKAVKREIELASQMRDAMAAAAAGKNPNVSAALAKEMQLGRDAGTERENKQLVAWWRILFLRLRLR